MDYPILLDQQFSVLLASEKALNLKQCVCWISGLKLFSLTLFVVKYKSVRSKTETQF